MNSRINYQKEKRKANIGIVASATVLVLALSISLAALFFYLDAVGEARTCQQKEEDFNPWENSNYGQYSYKTWEICGLTEEFAADFKETYHYYFAFDPEWYPFIIKMKGELGEEFQPLVDYAYEDNAEEPDPITVRGISIPIEDDIREYAIECINILYGEEFITEDNFEDYLGVSILDTTQKPMGRADFTVARWLGIFGIANIIAGILLLRKGIRNRKNIGLAEIREQEAMRQAAMWQNTGESNYQGFGGTGYSGEGAYSGFGSNTGSSGYGSFENENTIGMSGNNDYSGVNTGASIYGRFGSTEMPSGMEQSAAGYTGNAQTGYTNNSGVRLIPIKKSNVFLGIIGALGGALIGAGLWVALSMVGLIAGIAGFVMLKFALKGYEKLSGRLDKKGAIISLIIAAFMVLFANVLDYVVALCRAFFKWDASFDTIRYVVMNFGTLMTEADSWGGFGLNLVLGYGLSIWSSYRLIGKILTYKE